MWSIGNEIPETGTPQGVETARASPRGSGARSDPPGHSGDQQRAAAQHQSGRRARRCRLQLPRRAVHQDHEKLPDLPMYTAESLPKDAFPYWRAVETMPWVVGDFVWTAVDYLGESGIGWMGYSQDWQKLGPYPWHLAYSGEIDAIGRKRPAAYYRQVLWKTGIDPIAAFVRQPEGTEDLPDRHLYPITPPHLDWALDDVHPSWTLAGPGRQAARSGGLFGVSRGRAVPQWRQPRPQARSGSTPSTRRASASPTRRASCRRRLSRRARGGPLVAPHRRRTGRAGVSADRSRRPMARTWPTSRSSSSMRPARRSMRRTDDRTCAFSARGRWRVWQRQPAGCLELPVGPAQDLPRPGRRGVRAGHRPGPLVEIEVDGLPVQRLRLDTVPRCADIHVPYCVLTSRITSQRRTPAAR